MSSRVNVWDLMQSVSLDQANNNQCERPLTETSNQSQGRHTHYGTLTAHYDGTYTTLYVLCTVLLCAIAPYSAVDCGVTYLSCCYLSCQSRQFLAPLPFRCLAVLRCEVV